MRIHYLGHASFVLRFENGESILLDYGVSNAYGLASPVFDLSGAEPSIVAFSHDHPDHRRPGASFPKSRHLAGGGRRHSRALALPSD
jgi:L-ascorbate metabolism protein UlaG (beta-lactamase superfamily)